MSDDLCPHCGVSLQGEPVNPRWQHWHGDVTHYSRKMGHEIRGVYDGVLFWSCPDCRMAWPRWTSGPRAAVSKVAADDFNIAAMTA